jgi:hypothetical protein
MSGRAWMAVLTIGCLLFAAEGRGQIMTRDDIAKKYGNAIVMITVWGSDLSGAQVPPSNGNGIIVRSDGTIITALHVVGRKSDWKDNGDNTVDRTVSVTRRDANGASQTWLTSAVREYPEFDIAVLSVNGINLPNVVLALLPPPAHSQVALMLWDPPHGNFASIPRVFDAGLTDTDASRDGNKLTLTASVIKGHSGAPVFGKNGDLVAILTNGELNRSLAYAVPTYEFVNTIGIPPLSGDDEDILAKPETSATRLSAFSWTSPPNEFKPGRRTWTRIASDRWQEAYPDGTKEMSTIIKRTNVGGCDGSVIGNPPDEFQGFIPDRGCANMVFWFRRLPTRTWTKYVPLENVK